MIKNNIEKTNERLKKFTESGTGLLIQIKSIKELSPKSRRLDSFGLPDNMEEYLDYRIENFISYWEGRKHIDDDMIPALSPWYGIAEHTAFIGGEAEFGELTSWHHPFINDWSDRSKAKLDDNNTWLRLVLDGLTYISEKADGRFAVKLRGGEGAMDIANIARGNDIFYDFFEHPEEIHEFLDFCAKAARYTLTKQMEIAGQYIGGVITGFDIWLPGNSTGHLSEDASVMISPDQFREFGLVHTNKITAGFDHVFMHTHTAGKQNIPEIAKIDNVDYIEMSNDPNAPRSMEVYKELEPQLTDKTIVISVGIDEIKNNMEFLAGKKTILWYDAETVDEAIEAVALTRSIV